MDILQILQYIGCILTVLVGAYAVFTPKNTVAVTALAPQGAHGITEIRTVGAFFIILGVAPFFLGAAAFQMLGYAYFGAGVVRLISIFMDGSNDRTNWVAFVLEMIFGVVLSI
jgi:hypothetical protein